MLRVKSHELMKKRFNASCIVLFSACYTVVHCVLCKSEQFGFFFVKIILSIMYLLLISLRLTFRAHSDELCWNVLNDVVHYPSYFAYAEIIPIS